jgi:MFS family permease
LLSMLIVFGGLDGLTRAGDWQPFFLIVGSLMIVAGIAAWFLVHDVQNEPVQHDSMFRAMVHGLRPSAVRENPRLYLTFACLAILGISTQVFLPYLLIYIQRYLKIEAYALVLAVVLIGASVIGVLGGRLIDRVGKVRFLLPATGVYVVGLLLTSVARGLLPLIGAGLILMSGFMLTQATIGATIRDFTPPDRVGAVQGLRMTFYVLLPMVIGPFIGAAVIRNADEYYEDLGQLKQVPTPGIFIGAAVIVLFLIIPALALRRRDQAAAAASAVDAADGAGPA